MDFGFNYLKAIYGRGIPIFFKEGVRLDGAKVETFMGICIAAFVLHQNGHVCTVTSVMDGRHMENSLHYKGRAFDLRSRMIPKDKQARMVMAFKDALGDDWDVVLEKDHFHLEYDPK